MSRVAAALRGPFYALVEKIDSIGSFFNLLVETCYWTVVGPFTGQTRFAKLVPPLFYQVGVRSIAIVSMVSFLVGSILVLQTADKFEEFGTKDLVPSMVCVAIIRELGPLMTAIVMAGRVGAAFTAGLGSMVINEEKLALETMGINPVGYLVAPRYIAITVMMPALTVLSFGIGIVGGLVIGTTVFQIEFSTYVQQTRLFLSQADMFAGLIKSFVFGSTICMVACQCAFRVRGGPEGVGRNTMVSVVTSLVCIVIADFVLNSIFVVWLYPKYG